MNDGAGQQKLMDETPDTQLHAVTIVTTAVRRRCSQASKTDLRVRCRLSLVLILLDLLQLDQPYTA